MQSFGAIRFLEETRRILSLCRFASDSRPVHQRLFEHFRACHWLRFEDGFQRRAIHQACYVIARVQK